MTEEHKAFIERSIRRIISSHDDGLISDYHCADSLKRLIEPILNEKPKRNGILHKVHLWTDVSIGMFALLGLLWADLFNLFVQADLVFHLTIMTLAFGGIALERIFHGKKHGGLSTH